MGRILLVDDEPKMLKVLERVLQMDGHEVVSAGDGRRALELLNAPAEEFDVMVSDIYMEGVSGMELLNAGRRGRPSMSVVMITGHASVATAIEAMRMGAFDYVVKPFKIDELQRTVKRAVEYRHALSQNVDLMAQLDACRFEQVIARSEPMKQVCRHIERIAPTDIVVSVHGEHGVRKDLVAAAIHARSKRAAARLCSVSCAGKSAQDVSAELFGCVSGAAPGIDADREGAFEAAAGGTVYISGLESLPQEAQGRLMEFLQEKSVRRLGAKKPVPVDARLVVSSDVRMDKIVADGKFREDLSKRLAIISIPVLPLRERREDIPLLVCQAMTEACAPDGRRAPTVEPDVWNILLSYAWPGNARELADVVRHALKDATSQICKANLPESLRGIKVDTGAAAVLQSTDASAEHRARSLKAYLKEKEREYARQVCGPSPQS